MVKAKNILITGSNGQLGLSLRRASKYFKENNYFFTSHQQLSINNFDKINDYIVENKIHSIINCAAYTNVKGAEKNKKLADLVNNISVDNLAKICSEKKLQLIHISTDYVFDGMTNVKYLETDIPNPINYYGLTKLNGEKKVLSYNLINSVIIRSSWIYSLHSNSFLKKILNKLDKQEFINVIDNEIGSPTCSDDLAKFILKIIPIIKSKTTQIYNFSNDGSCSRYEFAFYILKLLNFDTKRLKPSKDIDKLVLRPRFTVLNCNKIKKHFDYSLTDWKLSLKHTLQKSNKDEIQM